MKISYDGRGLVHSHGHHDPRRIVWHDTESHDSPGIRDLEGIATYWHGVSWGPGAQRGIDRDGNVALYVDDDKIAYHVENHNTGSLGIEIVGFASFSVSSWLGRAVQLEMVARQTAEWSEHYRIPLVWSVEHGVSTHAMQSKAYRGSHYDPGFAFPKERVLRRAIAIRDGSAGKPHAHTRPRDYFWKWARWKLGEGEFKTYGRSNPAHRPPVPAKVPDAWWLRLEKLLAARVRAERNRREG